MKISHVRTTVVQIPTEEPLTGARVEPGTRPTVLLELGTDSDIEGIGFTFFGAALTRSLHHAVADIGEALVGLDPLARESVLAKARALALGAGPGGMSMLALSAIDIALWDIAGKALSLPLWKLLGGTGEPVPTYASGALMRNLTLDEAAVSARRLVENGFRSMKMQLALPGETSVEIEVARARLIREIVGAEADLMCDINQRWRVDQAIAIGRRLEEVGFAWLEDIAAHDDYVGLARIAAALSTPLAGGEYVYGLTPFRHMLEAGSVDIVMIDPFRAGGVTGWLKVAALAEAFNLPVVSHLAPELQVHLINAVPNGMTVEYMPWSVRLFEEVPWPEGGMLTPPGGPGLGLSLDREAIRRFSA
jgi:L-alanine-DL-glutamate epimerase-like enolase superfamily enzyme